MTDRQPSAISRRELLRYGALGGGAAVLAPSLFGASGMLRRSLEKGDSALASSITGQLAPFNPNVPGGEVPNLPKRLGLSNAADSSLFLNVAKYMQQACDDRGLGFLTAIYNLDAETQVAQTDAFFQRGIGALVEEPVNIEASNPQMMQAIKMGMCVISAQRPYADSQVAINQYQTGYGQGIAAVEWIKNNLDGKAQVSFFNDLNEPPIVPRDNGVLAALKTGGPGIQLVSNITNPGSTDGVASATSTILQAHPGCTVFLGASSSMLGALAAFQALGRTHDPKVYISSTAGSNADYEAIAAGTVYRATSAEPWNMWSYCIGQFAADWLEGKSIPKGLGAGPVAEAGREPMLTTIPEVKAFASAMEDPRGLWNNPSKMAQYVSFYGNISYATRQEWWRETWNP